MYRRAIVLGVVLSFGAALAGAQMAGAPEVRVAGQAAMGPAATPAQALDAMLNLLQGEFMGAAKAMPAAKFDFAPAKPMFAAGQEPKFEGVRTFGQQLAHVAQANFYFFSAVSGLKPPRDVAAIGKLTSREEVLAALEESFAFGHKAIATITPANAFEAHGNVDGMTTRATIAAFAVAHGYDHYGQMVEYLRMNGIVPPASAK